VSAGDGGALRRHHGDPDGRRLVPPFGDVKVHDVRFVAGSGSEASDECSPLIARVLPDFGTESERSGAGDRLVARAATRAPSATCQRARGPLQYAVVDDVTPNEIARSIGVTGLQFRNWLREQRGAGHPLVAGHEYRTRYRFTRAEADQLIAEFLSETPSGVFIRPVAMPSPLTSSDPFGDLTLSDELGHRVTELWMGEETLTLADLLRPGLRAVVVGINPSPISVAAGHYYQGRAGQRFYQRLDEAAVIDISGSGWEDDAAFATGIGFTDVVKRPTSRADGLRPGELQHGRELLAVKLVELCVRKVLFTFKASAEALLGPLDGHGFLADRTLADAEIFVMPGPMERTDRVKRALRDLSAWWEA
jgi:TDG/mug DNA glycosylase family protein